MGSTWSMFFPPKPEWSVNEIPDLTGQVMIVTGGNTGIGKETVKALLQHNAKVYIAGRTESRVLAAIKDLEAQTGKTAEFIRLDLADLNSVKHAAEEFKQKETQLNVLFNNGGVMWPPLDQLTSQNIDLVFGTNVLGHFYFTKLLLPTLLATAAAGNTARIIHTSSSGALFHPQKDGINYNTLLDGPARTKAGAVYLYGQSKLGNVFVSNELARRYGDQGIVSISLNPGNLRTELARHEKSQIKIKLISMLCYPVPMGALTQLWAGTTKEAASHNGGFLQPWARIGTLPSSSTDPAACKALWNWLEEQVARVE
ncbi:NAD-P-binding protein [Mycena maculata]|uniref:NAD-P-binding protein n=1 Tax=Mycena maculata TaxID=230809 RepID=A0AAD7I213_9AGAR|nr:NAD-P-binding protein [Mycena maculata]